MVSTANAVLASMQSVESHRGRTYKFLESKKVSMQN
jgi:hypothetical protein